MKPDTLALNYLLKLELAIQRLLKHPRDEGFIIDHKPLDGQENSVFEMVCKRIKAQLAQKASGTQDDIDGVLNRAIDLLGKRGLLMACFEPLLVWGIPYTWFTMIALISMAAIIATQQFLFFLLMPVLHVAGYFYYRHNRGKLLRKQMSKQINKA